MVVLRCVFSGGAVSVVARVSPHGVVGILLFITGILRIRVVVVVTGTIFVSVFIFVVVFALHSCGSFRVLLVVRLCEVNNTFSGVFDGSTEAVTEVECLVLFFLFPSLY